MSIDHPKRDFPYRLSAIAVLLLAFALRVWALDARSLWFDETFEYWTAVGSLSSIPETVRTYLNDPPGFSIILHFWLKIGQDAFTQRFLSVAVSLLGVIGMLLIGRRMSGRWGAVAAALLMAILPSQVHYAQESGQYIWVSSILVWNLLALVAIYENDKWSRYLWWLATAWATSYIFYGGVFTVVISAGVAFVDWTRTKDWSRLRRSAAVALGYVIGVLPLIIFFLPGQLFRGPTANAFVLQPKPFLEEVQVALSSTAQLAAFQFTGWPWTKIPLWLPTIMIWPMIALSFHPSSRPTGRRISLWLLCVWTIYYILGYLQIYPYAYRYGLILTPLLVAVVIQGASNLSWWPGHPWTRNSILLTLMVICFLSLPNRPLRNGLYPDQSWPWPETAQLEPIVQEWVKIREPETPVYVYYGATPAFRYYLRWLKYDSPNLSPLWIRECNSQIAERPAYCQNEYFYYGRWSRQQPAEYRAQEVLDFVAGRESFWIVFSHVYGSDVASLLESLAPQYTIANRIEDTGASIYLLQR